jgi:hypothetical protein
MSVLAKILGRENKAPVPVPTPEWPELDGQLSIRRLSPQERAEFFTAAAAQKATKNPAFRCFMATHCAILPDGTRAFDDGEWQQLLNDPGSGSALDRLAEHADELNVLSEWDKEEIKKKYTTTPSSDANSASPETKE